MTLRMSLMSRESRGGPQEMCGIASTPEENRTRKGESKYLIVEHEADARVALLSPVPEVR